MKNKIIIHLQLILLPFALFLSSCSDPATKEEILSLRQSNDSLNLLLDSIKNCCDCGEIPAGLAEVNEVDARNAWERYKTGSKTEKIRGTWLDKEYNRYLFCTFNSNIYSGIGLNEHNCPMVIYAIQLVSENDTTYKFYVSNEAWSAKDCLKENLGKGSGTCPVRCP